MTIYWPKNMDDKSLVYYSRKHRKEIGELETQIKVLMGLLADEEREMDLRGLNG